MLFYGTNIISGHIVSGLFYEESSIVNYPQVLTIAGSDSGGGAGIQADIKTFQELGVFATSVLTAVTAQNSCGVQALQTLDLSIIAAQIDAVVQDFNIRALKTGMLVNDDVICCVADKVRQYQLLNLVIDPVMIAKGGHILLADSALGSLCNQLLPLAKVITPNLPEAEAIVGFAIHHRQQVHQAAQAICRFGVNAVVIKGGHSSEEEVAEDYLYSEGHGEWFSYPRINTVHTHGTGCTFSAAVCAQLAHGFNLRQSVAFAKDYIHAAIAHAPQIGHGHGPINHAAWRCYGER